MQAQQPQNHLVGLLIFLSTFLPADVHMCACVQRQGKVPARDRYKQLKLTRAHGRTQQTILTWGGVARRSPSHSSCWDLGSWASCHPLTRQQKVLVDRRGLRWSQLRDGGTILTWHPRLAPGRLSPLVQVDRLNYRLETCTSGA